jgi:hypothetical protein
LLLLPILLLVSMWGWVPTSLKLNFHKVATR